MLIRNPKAEAQQKTAATTEELVQQLAEQLQEGSAEDCIHLLSSNPSLPADLRKSMLKRMVAESDVRLQQVFMNHLLPGLTAKELHLLLDQLNNDDAGLRSQIIDGLSQVSEDQQRELLFPELKKRLEEGDRDTRILTLNLITWLENPKFLPVVLKLLSQEEDINVCMTALDALPSLKADPELPLLDEIAEKFSDEPYASFALANIRKELAAQKNQDASGKEFLSGNN
ncbi:hypothetical protein SAMN05660443_1099 [Marinospirillum celere]|uniref:HEAT repeat-containing protein n=1 Tax=Marinospirillum celere TaxID=1122252 RepID=A0A1I1FS19_9GAMM|nr:HEAT repeat domain-containing protein [Marinospirillum celere]SFC00438.1 hypothetical protein SAMN05660443_1099 [Marinospirillum celere]